MKYEYHLVEAWIYLICAILMGINTALLYWALKNSEYRNDRFGLMDGCGAFNWFLAAVCIFTGIYYHNFA